MPAAVLPPFAPWQSFYVLIGSAAATLTGLMFVVITLSARRPSRAHETFGAFATPTVVHFGTALLVAALLNAPWPILWTPALLLGLCGLGGVIYALIVLRRARQQTAYQAVLEDWLWHTIFPLVSDAALLTAGLLLTEQPTIALFISGGASVLLLFIGIHNAWDAVVYITVQSFQSPHQDRDDQEGR